MAEPAERTFTAFAGTQRLARGALADVAVAVKAAEGNVHDGPILTFDDETGTVFDLDLRGGPADVAERYRSGDADAGRKSARPRGRPRLGVVAREVTLLPRQWDWLATQPGGASQALRRLVEKARRDDGGRTQSAAQRERAYRFMSAIGGDLPGFEDASRALFKGDRAQLVSCLNNWPKEISDHALLLLGGEIDDEQIR